MFRHTVSFFPTPDTKVSDTLVADANNSTRSIGSGLKKVEDREGTRVRESNFCTPGAKRNRTWRPRLRPSTSRASPGPPQLEVSRVAAEPAVDRARKVHGVPVGPSIQLADHSRMIDVGADALKSGEADLAADERRPAIDDLPVAVLASVLDADPGRLLELGMLGVVSDESVVVPVELDVAEGTQLRKPDPGLDEDDERELRVVLEELFRNLRNGRQVVLELLDAELAPDAEVPEPLSLPPANAAVLAGDVVPLAGERRRR